MDEAIGRLEALYREHGTSLLAYLRRSAGRGDSAEDLLHETFVQALRRPDRLGEVVSPRAWLFAVARRVAATALRRRRPTTTLSTELPARLPSPVDPRVETMREAIAALPGPQREVLELRLRHELSYEEIAAVLEIPVGTVRSRIHYAVGKLRDRLSSASD